MSRGRKERTPAQLAVLAQAREKAKIVIAERAKINALAKKEDSEPEDVAPPPEPEAVSEESHPPGLRGGEFCTICRFFVNFSTFTKIPQVPSFQAHSPVKTVFRQNPKTPENRKTHQARTLTKTRRSFP
jgi:hypothetical protein